ncbi:MAG: NADH-ubiquinone oxidoreductase-F iron-sulfur binding region domain-containing protein [Candidatus Pacearchaeota archaeon]|jgi:NADH:ubiquinone oxidoreductase subunit F (NADH-binding)
MQIIKKTQLKALKVARTLGPLGVIETLNKKRVVGRGGASFPVSDKWKYAIETKSDKKYVICNADEGEPGTFKDKLILIKNPETLIEGIIIAAETIGASEAFIYLRGEYEGLLKNLRTEISSIIKKSKTNVSIKIVMGAGAYICGEETAIIKSIQGFRGQPYFKPPFPPVEGLFGKPTVINNVETLVNIAQALGFSDYDPDLRLFSVSGSVKKPGVYEFKVGTKLTEVVKKAEPAGKPKAVYFGCFGGCMEYKDMELTPENICKEECIHGAGTIIVVGEKISIIDMAYIISKFYTFESCGKCTPCREGTIQILLLLKKLRAGKGEKKDLELLKELAMHIKETSLCGLGQSSTNHIISAMHNFPDEFEELIKR